MNRIGRMTEAKTGDLQNQGGELIRKDAGLR